MRKNWIDFFSKNHIQTMNRYMCKFLTPLIINTNHQYHTNKNTIYIYIYNGILFRYKKEKNSDHLNKMNGTI